MSFMDWVFNQVSASDDVIDLHFILSDLVDIPITEAERTESAYFDALASADVNDNHDDQGGIPMGKRVY